MGGFITTYAYIFYILCAKLAPRRAGRFASEDVPRSDEAQKKVLMNRKKWLFALVLSFHDDVRYVRIEPADEIYGIYRCLFYKLKVYLS